MNHNTQHKPKPPSPAAKVTNGKPAIAYDVFFGEFTQQWVATRTVNGSMVHSVQRPTREQAEADIRIGELDGNNAPLYLTGRGAYDGASISQPTEGV